jgi:hypothetical protein
MRFLLIAAIAVGQISAPAISARAANWMRYDNARFAYTIDLPPGFSGITEADNGDGGVSMAPNGKAELRVWGSYLVDSDFKSEIAGRVQSDMSDGWAISYDRRMAKAASWSGGKGARVFYTRAMMGCDGATIYFQLEYDKAALDRYNDIIGRLVKSFRPAC